MIKLWGTTTRRTLRPIWVAEELVLDYELVSMGPRTGETQTPEYTSISPKRKVPLLTMGNFTLSESPAICRYLIAKFDTAGIFYVPETQELTAEWDEWASFIYGEIDEASLYVVRRHGDLAAIYGDAPRAVSSALEYASQHLNVVGERLSDQPFLLGEKISDVDIVLVTCLDWAKHCGIELPENLDKYRRKLKSRSAYLRARERNAA